MIYNSDANSPYYNYSRSSEIVKKKKRRPRKKARNTDASSSSSSESGDELDYLLSGGATATRRSRDVANSDANKAARLIESHRDQSLGKAE